MTARPDTPDPTRTRPASSGLSATRVPLADRFGDLSVSEIPERALARLSGPIASRLLGTDDVISRGRRHLDAGRVTVAGQFASSAVRRVGDADTGEHGTQRRTDAFLLLAGYHSARSEWDDAMEALSHIEEIDSADILLAKADLYRRTSQYTLSLQSLRHAARLSALGAARLFDDALRRRDFRDAEVAAEAFGEHGARPIGLLVSAFITNARSQFLFARRNLSNLRSLAERFPDSELVRLATYFFVSGRPNASRTLMAGVDRTELDGEGLRLHDVLADPRSQDDPEVPATGLADLGEARVAEIARSLAVHPNCFPILAQLASVAGADYLLASEDLLAGRDRDLARVLAGTSGRVRTREVSQAMDALAENRLDLKRLAIALSAVDWGRTPELVRIFADVWTGERVSSLLAADVRAVVARHADTDMPALREALFAGLDAASVPARIHGARAYWKARERGEALRLLDAALARPRPARRILLERMRFAVRQDDEARIGELLEQGERLDPSTPAMIELHLAAERFEVADRAFAEAVGASVDLSAAQREAYMRSLLNRGQFGLVTSLQDAADAAGADTTTYQRTTAAELRTHLDTLIGAGLLDEAEVFSPAFQVPESLVDALAALADETGTGETAHHATLVTSTLRPGGAERQVMASAVGLSEHHPGGIEVLARTLDPAISADFFSGDIFRADAELLGLDMMGDEESSEDGDAASSRSDVPATHAALLALLQPELREIAEPLYHRLRERRPAVLHLWQDRVCVAGAIAGLLAGVPAIVLSTRSTRPKGRRRFRPYLAGMYRSFHARFADRVTFSNNSHFGARDYESWLDLPEGTFQVVHNGLDLRATIGRAGPRADREELRAELGIPADAPVAGWVGRLTSEKQPVDFVEAAALAVSRVPQLHFLVVGDGPLEPDLRRAITQAGLGGRMHLTGHRKPVEPYMAQADLLCLTSAREGLPNVLIEAQALSIPVATYAAGGAPEAVEAGESGYVVSSNTPAELGEVIAKHFSDTDTAIAMSRWASGWARKAFGLGAMVEATEALYAGALAKAGVETDED